MKNTALQSKTKLNSNARADLYNNDKIIAWIHRKLESQCSKENLELIKRYDTLMISLSMSKATRLKHLRTIYNLNQFYENGSWQNITKQDVLNIVSRFMSKYSLDGQETNTTWDHKKILKIFVRWVLLGSREFNEVGDPEQIKGVKLKKVKDKIAREDLLSEEDRVKLLHACDHPRDRALFDVQFEAGTRPGEILNLKIKHLKFDDYGAIIRVDGKTGSRPVRLVKSAPSLVNWYNRHPLKDDPEAALWPSLQSRTYGQPLSYYSVRQLLRKRCDKANLGKRAYLNLFRHSEATDAATFMTEAQMKLRHGWTRESKMPARYVHLVQSDVERTILERYGLEQKEKQSVQLFKPCPACKSRNTADVEFCENCGKALDLKKALEMDEENKQKIDHLTTEMEKVTNWIEMQKHLQDPKDEEITRLREQLEKLKNS